MRKLRIWVELTDEEYLAYEEEAKRRRVETERIVERVVHTLLRDLEREEREGTDHPIVPA